MKHNGGNDYTNHCDDDDNDLPCSSDQPNSDRAADGNRQRATERRKKKTKTPRNNDRNAHNIELVYMISIFMFIVDGVR